MKVLILGKNGMLGHEVVKEFEDSINYDKDELDITNKEDVKRVIGEIKPDVVINVAGYTDVDGCESNKELAFLVNGKAVGFIAEACKENDAEFLHISSDYVFDGKKEEGYKENDEKHPINVYGESKAMADDLIQKKMKKYYIVRTSWLYGKHGKNFVDTMLKLSEERKELKVVNDQRGCPTYTKDLAKAIKKILKNKKHGIFHVTNAGSCTWYEYAKKTFELTKRDIKVIPVTSEEIDRPAKRPICSVLLNTKIEPLRPWQEALEEYMGKECNVL